MWRRAVWLQHRNVSAKSHGTYLKKLNHSSRLQHLKSHNTADVNMYYTFLKRYGKIYLHSVHTGIYIYTVHNRVPLHFKKAMRGQARQLSPSPFF
jgi:hypothetical protein